MKIGFALVLSGAALILSWLLTGLFLRVAERFSLIDYPNSRSSHTLPIPRGGGISIVIVFLSAVIGLYFFGSLPANISCALTVGGVLIASVGFADDHSDIAAKWRFLFHITSATFAVAMLGGLPEIQAGQTHVDLGLAGDALAVLCAVWFINLYNFMDGIDGIAGVEAITALGGGALIMSLQGQSDWLALFGVMAACVAGFLVWNWPPAKVFMGDACSGFLGMTLAILAIATSATGAINLWSWLILFGVFVVDATTTLITRLTQRDRWYEAHRSHAYQILSRRLGSHLKVSVGVIIINTVCLLPLAFLAAKYPNWGIAICAFAFFPLVILALRIGAGRSAG